MEAVNSACPRLRVRKQFGRLERGGLGGEGTGERRLEER